MRQNGAAPVAPATLRVGHGVGLCAINAPLLLLLLLFGHSLTRTISQSQYGAGANFWGSTMVQKNHKNVRPPLPRDWVPPCPCPRLYVPKAFLSCCWGRDPVLPMGQSHLQATSPPSPAVHITPGDIVIVYVPPPPPPPRSTARATARLQDRRPRSSQTGQVIQGLH